MHSTRASYFGWPAAASSLLLGGSSLQATRGSLLRGQRRPGPVRRRRPDGVRTKTCQLRGRARKVFLRATFRLTLDEVRSGRLSVLADEERRGSA